MDEFEKVKILVQEIRDQEQEIRQQLRTSTQLANLSIVILALAAVYLAKQVDIAILCAVPVFLNVAALSNLNTAIDVAHQAIMRDWLQGWANRELGGDVFVVGELTKYRRLSPSGIAVNSLAAGILVTSWVLGMAIAAGRPWFLVQILGTLVLAGLTAWSLWDYATIRRRTVAALAQLKADFEPSS
jgi:hypothetical protein